MLDLDPRGGIEVVSCPTCGRTKIDLIGLAARFKEAVRDLDTKGKRIKVAVMGCVVNGPGEAREADFGIAGGDGFGVFFREGETVCRVEEEQIIPRLLEETLRYIDKPAEKA
jgi:(E)-4-hydroxy-3-methylbut-2-enyl-diphosphate synthase